MHCAMCNRPLFTAAVMVGAEAIGPKCAKKAGLVALATTGAMKGLRLVSKQSRAPAIGVVRDTSTRDLFEDEERRVT